MKRSLRFGIGVATFALIAAACGGSSNDLAEVIVNSQTDAANIDISSNGETITIKSEDGQTVIKTDSDGSVSVEGTADDGETTFSSGGDIPADFPLPVAPGGTMSISATTPDGDFYTIIYPGEMFDQLVTMYTEYLNTASDESSMSNGTTDGLKWFNGITTLKDGTFASAGVIETDGQVAVTLIVASDS
ncbi:MAG: hypothetical protein IIB04_00175 [Acidobacteria bacterium]|nr:hypothetical protein [Acidobacteriota bacterium]MCH8985010.1 hypothetical protein [Acidobacteriota bacterium]